MKKLLVLLIVGCYLGIIVPVVSAAPVGNPAKPVLEKGDMPLKVSAELDFVTERELDASCEIDKLNWYGAKISYTLEEKVDLYCLLGAAEGEFSEKNGNDVVYETETEFAWGLGATALLYEFENGIKLGLDGKYRRVEPSVDKVTVDGTEYSLPSGLVTNIEVEYSEWQIALGVSKEFETVEFGKFIPYGGIKYSDVETTMKLTIPGLTIVSDDINSDDVFGIFIGCDYLPTDNVSIGIEGRFIDETAFTVSVNYKF